MNAFICGGLHPEEEDGPACSSPTKKSSSSKRSKDNNPYSTRGLDKFSQLLADLDEKRQKVYSKMNPHDISFVRFAYSKNDDIVPIVVKVKNNNKDHNNKKHKSEELKVRHLTSFSEPIANEAAAAAAADVEGKKQHKSDQSDNNTEKKEKKRSLFSWNNYMMMMKHPSFYVPAVVILILVFLTVFGRSVATLCTCVIWYVVPTLSDHGGSSKQPGKMTGRAKKDYVRELSEKKMKGLPSAGDKSSTKHSHQKSW